RMHVKECEVWEKTRTHDWGTLRRAIFSNWKLFLYLVALMTFMNFSSHGTQDMYPTFLQRFRGFDPGKRSLISAVASCGALIGGVVFGYYSDLKGRRRAIVTALLLAVAVIPIWALSPNTALIQATFAEHMSYSTTMAMTAGIVFVGGSIVAAMGRENRAHVFGTTVNVPVPAGTKARAIPSV